ncbi:MAG: DUF1385 domain-containing protein [Coriobacteriia bacterium]|nr:DUF1385 domain-containing protein [Coriobacteriia bacterium]
MSTTKIGGQAVLEGVMMRGKRNWAVAARDEQGEIHTELHPLNSAADRNAWMRWPIIRGVVALGQSLALGTKALAISARIAGLEEEPAEGSTDGERESVMTGGIIASSVVMGIVLAIGIFVLLPAFITQAVMGPASDSRFLWNAFDGLMRITIFFAYVYAISRIPDIRRVFRYHGAEHKVIAAIEAGEPLTIEKVRPYSTLHTRCGTAFLIMVMALAILVFSLVPINAMVTAWGITSTAAILAIRIVIRLMFLPLVAGLAYEVTVKWAAPRTHLAIVKVLMWPGLQMQRLTTGDPDDGMIEVAITAAEVVLAADAESAKPAESDQPFQ